MDAEGWARMMRAQLATVSRAVWLPMSMSMRGGTGTWTLAKQPPRQLQILQDAWAGAADNLNFALQAASGKPLSPAEGDARYANDAWSQWLFNVYAHGYRNYADWWSKEAQPRYPASPPRMNAP